MKDYLYDLLYAFYDKSDDAMIIYDKDSIKYTNEAFEHMVGFDRCFARIETALGFELVSDIENLLKDNHVCGINMRFVGNKMCKIRACKCEDDIVMVIHAIKCDEKAAEDARFALDSIFAISQEQSDVIMTVNIAISTIERKISNVEDVKTYINSANRACLLAAKHNITISELSAKEDRNKQTCSVSHAVNTVKKMCETLIAKERLQISYKEKEVLYAACNIYELENILYSVISQILRENKAAGEVYIIAKGYDKEIEIGILCKKIVWDKSVGTDILRAENRVKVCGGTICIEENKITLRFPKGKNTMQFKEEIELSEEKRRAIIELCEVI